jgi:WD40 repeat protein
MAQIIARILIASGVALALIPVFAADEPTVWRGEKMTPGVLAYSPDGKRIASGGDYRDRSFLWDVESGKQIAELTECGDIIESASFSPDGKVLVTNGLDTDKSQWRIVVWNGVTGKRQTELPVNIGWRTEVVPSGKSLAVATMSGSIAFFQFPKLQRFNDFKTDAVGGVDHMTISPDGKAIATVRDKAIHVWVTADGKMLTKFSTDTPVKTVAFTQDSKGLCAGTEGGLILRWALNEQRAKWSRKIHSESVADLAIAANDAFMVSVGQDGKVNVLDVGTGQVIRSLEAGVNNVASVAISPDARSIAAGHYGGISIWKTATNGQRESQIQRPPNAVKVNGHSFAVIRDHAAWVVAMQRCKEAGGHLATFETPAEREVVIKLCRGADEPLWLGATDAEEEGKWKWVNDVAVAPDEQAKWALDNHNGVQHWLCFWKQSDNFDDADGGERLFYLCEWDD